MKQFLKEFGKSFLHVGQIFLIIAILVTTMAGLIFIMMHSWVWGTVACVLATWIYLAIIEALNKIHGF